VASASIAVVVLAGGKARRFPHKLEQSINGVPLIVHCYRALRQTPWPIYIAGNGPFSPDVEKLLDAELLLDRWPGRGPLHALVSACGAIEAERIFAVAADMPQLDPGVLEQLAAAWQPGNEAVVPQHDDRIEPLAALYERRAVLREGFDLFSSGGGAMRQLVARLATRFVPFDARYFYNVNRPEDVAGITAVAR
jgi:molybdopterin-guanine dinucleotide biosynthesis protein A